MEFAGRSGMKEGKIEIGREMEQVFIPLEEEG